MKSWKLEVIEDSVQTKKYDSFIGGKPKLPSDIEIPKCGLCGKELTFMFQVAFPQGHTWSGRSIAVFYCVESWHDEYCIPELPKQIADADIPEGFLNNYERNFRVLVFDTSLGKINDTYQEKVAFQTVPEKQTRQKWDLVSGGRPIWVMGEPEKPHTIAGIENPDLLLQVKEDHHIQNITYRIKGGKSFYA